MRCEFRDLARHAITEAHADAEQQVTLLDGHVGPIRAMHARKAKEALLVGRDGAESEQGRRARCAEAAHDVLEHICLLREDDAAARKDQRLLGRADGLNHRVNLPLIADVLAAVAAQMHRLWICIVKLRIEDILGHIDDDRPRAARARDVERLFEHARQVLYLLDEVIVLRDWRRDTTNIRLLEGILADVGVSHLSRDADERHRIRIGRRDTRDEIRRTRAGGREDDADLARRARIAVCRMDSSLLMARQDVRKLHFIDSIVEREHRAAGISEYDVHAFILQAREHSLCTIHQQVKAPLYLEFNKKTN